MKEAYIHLRVPAATKGRWVRESRAAGMRLTDWIVEQVDGREDKNEGLGGQRDAGEQSGEGGGEL